MSCTGKRALLAVLTLHPQTQALCITAPSTEDCVQTYPGKIPHPPAALSPVPRAPRGTSADPYPDTLVRRVGRGHPKQTPLQSYEFVYPACPAAADQAWTESQGPLPLSKTEPYAPSSV